MTINIVPAHAKSMTCFYKPSQPCLRVFQSAIKLQSEGVLGVNNVVPQALCKHSLKAQALRGSSHGNDTLTKQNAVCSAR